MCWDCAHLPCLCNSNDKCGKNCPCCSLADPHISLQSYYSNIDVSPRTSRRVNKVAKVAAPVKIVECSTESIRSSPIAEHRNRKLPTVKWKNLPAAC